MYTIGDIVYFVDADEMLLLATTRWKNQDIGDWVAHMTKYAGRPVVIKSIDKDDYTNSYTYRTEENYERITEHTSYIIFEEMLTPNPTVKDSIEPHGTIKSLFG